MEKLHSIIKILSLSLLIVPIVIVIYLIFPRTEVNIKILEASNTNLGIPDEIGLGSFQSFADSTKKVFNLLVLKIHQHLFILKQNLPMTVRLQLHFNF